MRVVVFGTVSVTQFHGRQQYDKNTSMQLLHFRKMQVCLVASRHCEYLVRDRTAKGRLLDHLSTCLFVGDVWKVTTRYLQSLQKYCQSRESGPGETIRLHTVPTSWLEFGHLHCL